MEEREKNNYEITFWLKEENPSVIKDLLLKNNCEILEEKELKKMQLSYPIKKEKFAFFGVIKFSSYSEAIKNMEGALNLNQSILRYAIGNVNKKIESPENSEIRSQSPMRERSAYAGSSFKKKEEEILTNEGLEKKIEEILN